VLKIKLQTEYRIVNISQLASISRQALVLCNQIYWLSSKGFPKQLSCIWIYSDNIIRIVSLCLAFVPAADRLALSEGEIILLVVIVLIANFVYSIVLLNYIIHTFSRLKGKRFHFIHIVLRVILMELIIWLAPFLGLAGCFIALASDLIWTAWRYFTYQLQCCWVCHRIFNLIAPVDWCKRRDNVLIWKARG